ncbi:MAG: hypothetical protein KJ804_08530 [Proteobacteria bacterium]|nr:hypothetical protein [Pseudomonadota bacterium]MBU1058342.1 hypothetical protein [Pseudomonadota bacterium]
MTEQKIPGDNEQGFVLILSLLMLLILTIIGVSATNNTSIELQIAGNDRVHKQTFYQADGGTELGIRLAYENALCINSGGFPDYNDPSKFIYGNIVIPQTDLSFAQPGQTGTITYSPETLNGPLTTLTISGESVATPGSGLSDIAGYDGLGKSSPGSTHFLYNIRSFHSGPTNSQSQITLQWRLSGNLVNNASPSDCLSWMN